MLFTVLFHPRRRHRHRWRNISGKYLVLPWVHLDQVVLCLLGRHRCRVGLLGQGVLWDQLGRVRHRVLERRFDRLVLVVHLRRLGQHHRVWLEFLWLGCRQVLSLHLCLGRQVVRLVQVGRVVLLLHPCQVLLGFRSDQVLQVRQVGLRGLVVQVGMVCTAVV